MPVIVALNRFGSDTEREFKMIRKHLGEQGVEALVCEHFAKGSKGATNLAKSMVKLIDEKLDAVIQETFKLRGQLNRSGLEQINEHALNTTSPHANALIC